MISSVVGVLLISTIGILILCCVWTIIKKVV
jgi:hypothetical protein